MKKSISKIVAVFLAIGVMCCGFIINVCAAGTSNVNITGTMNIGDTITASFNFNHPSDKIAYIEATLSYDAQILEFIEAEGAMTKGSSGAILFNVNSMANASKSVNVKFKFRVKTTGNAYIGVKDNAYGICYNAEEQEITFKGTGYTVAIVDKTASKSSNANLTHITPSSGTLTPKFSAETTSYSLTVPNSVTTVTLGAATAHSGATWDVEGSKEMKVGNNKRVIVVTAEDGTTKKYTINITRLAADGTTPEPQEPDTENPTDSRVSVTADGKDMYIADSFDTENLPEGYTVDVYDYNGKEVPCIKKGNAVLLFLTSLDGQNGGFFRALEDGSFTAFVGFNSQSLFYEALKPDKVPEGYSEIELDIGGVKVTAYQSNDTSMTEFVLIYAKGPGGYTGFYRYDTTEHTLQRAVGLTLEYSEEKTDNSVMDNINGLDLPTKVVAITIIAIMALLIAAIIVLIVKIARSGKYDEEEEYEEVEEDEEDNLDFEFVSISDRDSNEE